jgi:hypothetical protein
MDLEIMMAHLRALKKSTGAARERRWKRSVCLPEAIRFPLIIALSGHAWLTTILMPQCPPHVNLARMAGWAIEQNAIVRCVIRDDSNVSSLSRSTFTLEVSFEFC